MHDIEKQSSTIFASEEVRKGHFSNNMFVSHGPEEFILDWIMDSPSGRELVSRIIVTPGHMKRIMAAVKANIEMYESKFGEIRVADDIPPHSGGLVS
ncbi:MAG: DUF3467 domain-containing protein [Syntrophorhabdaceae bacterium]